MEGLQRRGGFFRRMSWFPSLSSAVIKKSRKRDPFSSLVRSSLDLLETLRAEEKGKPPLMGLLGCPKLSYKVPAGQEREMLVHTLGFMYSEDTSGIITTFHLTLKWFNE